MSTVRALIRVSTGRQAEEGHSLEQQEHRLREYASRDDDLPVVVYREEGVSGASDHRPQRERLLADLERGDRVAVTSLDRLGRSTRDLLATFDLIEKRGATLVSLREAIDTSTAAGRLLRTILAAVAEFERELGRERTSAGIAGHARRGRSWGPPAYGLRRDGSGLEWDPAERATLERIFGMRERGLSKSAIAAELTRDTPTRNGARAWAPAVVAKILAGRQVLGEFPFGDEWHQGGHDPIMSEERWQAVQALDEQSRKFAPGGRSGRMSERHLFQRGMLRCECGEAMLPRSGRDRADHYVCRAHKLDSTSCPMPPLRRDTIDEVAVAMFEEISLDVEATRDHVVRHLDARVRETQERRDRAAREVIELEAQADRLDRDYRSGVLPADVYARLVTAITEERTAAEAEHERAVAQVEQGTRTRASVDAESETLRRPLSFAPRSPGRSRTPATSRRSARRSPRCATSCS